MVKETKPQEEEVETEEWQITARLTEDARQALFESVDELSCGQYTVRKIEF